MSTLPLGALRPQDPLRPPAAPGMGRGFAFALLAHAALLAALSAGVSWRSQPTPAFEAELWSAVPQAAAPKAQEVEPEPPAPEPEPVQRPAPAPPPPPPAENPQLQRDAEIAVAKLREQKLKKQQEAERLAELEEERKKQRALKDKLERERLAKLEKDKLEREKKEREKQEREKQEREKQEAKLDAKREAEAKLKKDKQAKAEEAQRTAKLEAQRQENLRRIQGMAGASGGPEATGSALKSSGPSASYGGRIKARIRPNIIYTDMPSGNPVAEVEVRTLPSGQIVASKLLKASGDAEWDKAVLRAIEKTGTLPRDTDGRVPPLLVISFQPRE